MPGPGHLYKLVVQQVIFGRPAVIVLLACLLTLPVGCDGPAEEAGESLDQTLEQVREQAAGLKEEVDSYKQQIAGAREELKTTRAQLEKAKNELDRLKKERLDIIADMKQLEKITDDEPGSREKSPPRIPDKNIR